MAAMGALAGCAPTNPTQGAANEPMAETGEAVAGDKAAGAWDAQPDSVADQVAATEDHEVVVVGAGNSGIVCALEVAQLGGEVLVLEQSGAATMWAGDIDACDSKIMKDAGENVDKEFIIHDPVSYTHLYGVHLAGNAWRALAAGGETAVAAVEPLGFFARAHERRAEAFAHTVGVAQEECEPAFLADGLHGAGERFQIVAVHHGAFHDIDALALGRRSCCHHHLLGDVQCLRLPNIPLVVNHAASLPRHNVRWRLSYTSGL